jgi:peptidoglycan/LPS O-acetylase OafA/YrhL
MRQTNVPVLDTLRAFAALSVCMYHFVCTTTGYVKTQWILNLFSIGQFGVQLFFVISGFVIPWAMYNAGYRLKNFFAFFLKRISRLEPPYIFSIILALLILYIREKYFGKQNDHIHVSLKQVALHFGYLIPFFKDYQWLNQVYWTLAIEFQYYLFIAVVFVPLIGSAKVIRYIVYMCILALSFVPGREFLFHWLPVFLLGILLFLKKSGSISVKEYFIVTFIVVCFCFFKYEAGAVIFSVIPVVFVLVWENFKLFGLHAMGKFSYSIYLIHPIIGASFINILSHRFNDPLTKACVIFSGLLITIVAAWLMYICIEKPSKSLSASIKYTKSLQPAD